MTPKKIARWSWRPTATGGAVLLGLLLMSAYALGPRPAAAQDTAQTPESAPPEPPAATAELRIAREIVDREAVGESGAFTADVGQVAAWTRVTGAENTVIEHVWRYQDMEWIVPLEIASPSWRTWSRKIILPEWIGAWEVEVRDQEGNTLATKTFTVDAPAPAPSSPEAGSGDS